jgi:hypothetical protein
MLNPPVALVQFRVELDPVPSREATVLKICMCQAHRLILEGKGNLNRGIYLAKAREQLLQLLVRVLPGGVLLWSPENAEVVAGAEGLRSEPARLDNSAEYLNLAGVC